MDVNVFLADSVVAAENEPYAQGVGWDSILVSKVPCVHPRIGIGVVFQVPWDEANHTHEFAIDVIDPDGIYLTLSGTRDGENTENVDIRGLMGQLNVGKPPLLGEGETQVVPIAINIDQMTLTKVGAYAVAVSANGRELGRLPFYVRSSNTTVPATAGPRFV